MRIAEHLPSRNSRIVRWGGNALLLLALVYCGLTIARLGTDEIIAALSPQAWLVTSSLGLVYGMMLSLLALAWMQLAQAGRSIDPINSLACYGPGVIAKYIPGSVFQYGSRQLLGAEFGLGQKDMAKASLFEAGLHIPAALLSAALLYFGGSLAVLVAGGGAVSALLVFRSRPVIVAASLQVVFFLSFGLIAATLAQFALGIASPDRLASLFMLAWLAGFLVPVAPGGIGVRESALLALAGPLELAGTVAAFALLTRLATTLGDAAFGLTGYGALVSRRSKRQASE